MAGGGAGIGKPHGKAAVPMEVAGDGGARDVLGHDPEADPAAETTAAGLTGTAASVIDWALAVADPDAKPLTGED